jgi:hypothetical protein
MADEPSLYATIDRLKGLVDDLHKLLHGDANTRAGGLISEFDAQRAEIQSHGREIHLLREDINHLRRRRPIIWLWLMGFTCFSLAAGLMVVAGVNSATPANWLDASPGFAIGMSLFFLLVSAPLFLAGFGWLDGK